MTRGRWIAAGAGALAALAVVAVLVVVLPGGGGRQGPPRVTRGLELALQDNAVFLERSYYDRATALGQARQLGVTWMRTSVLWARVESQPGRFDWSQYDSLVAAAARAGIAVEMSLMGPAPRWATGDGARG